MKVEIPKYENKSNAFIFWLIVILLGGMIFSLFVAQTVILLILAVHIYNSIKQKRFNYIKTPLDTALLAFIIARVLSIIFSTNFSTSVESLNREIIFYSAFFLFTFFLSTQNENTYLLLFKILIFAAVAASVYGTSKVFLGITDRASSSTAGYSTLGMFLTVVFTITLGLGKNKKFFKSRILWSLILLIIMTGILFTYNRTHWGIVGAISLFVMIIKERKLLPAFAILFGAIIILVPSLTERFVQLINFSQHLSDRDTIWKGAYLLMYDHPLLGFGTRTFREIFPLLNSLKDTGISSWHSDYLQMYFESGAAGLIAFLLLMVLVYRNGIIVIKNKLVSDFDRELIFSVLLGISAFYLTAFVGGFILDPVNSLLFQFLIAVVAVYSLKSQILKKSNIVEPV